MFLFFEAPSCFRPFEVSIRHARVQLKETEPDSHGVSFLVDPLVGISSEVKRKPLPYPPYWLKTTSMGALALIHC